MIIPMSQRKILHVKGATQDESIGFDIKGDEIILSSGEISLTATEKKEVKDTILSYAKDNDSNKIRLGLFNTKKKDNTTELEIYSYIAI